MSLSVNTSDLSVDFRGLVTGLDCYKSGGLCSSQRIPVRIKWNSFFTSIQHATHHIQIQLSVSASPCVTIYC